MLEGRGGERLVARQPRSDSSPVFAFLIGLIFVLIVFVVGMIGWSALKEPPAPRTSAERDLARFEGLTKTDPSDPGAHAGLGMAYMQTGGYPQAVDHLKKAVKLKAQEPLYYTEMAKAYLGMGKTKEALGTLARAKKLNEKFEEAWFQEGKIYFDQEDYPNAISSLTKSMELQPSASDTHYLLGLSFERSSKTEAAVAHYREAVKYMPDYRDAIDALARLQVKR